LIFLSFIHSYKQVLYKHIHNYPLKAYNSHINKRYNCYIKCRWRKW